MASKKYLIVGLAVLTGIVFGFLGFVPASKTFYIKNQNNSPASAGSKIGDLSNNIIPSIKLPKNLTYELAASIVEDIISANTENSNTQIENPPQEQALMMPDPEKIAEEFIKNGIIEASRNITDTAKPNLKLSADNGKESIMSYLNEIQEIINNNLKGQSLIGVLEEINANNGQGVEKLTPIINAHEIAASQIEEKPVPSGLKNLISEEIRLLRITANILKPLTNVESDPLAAIAATQQFVAVMQNWQDLQNKFDAFIISFGKK